MNTNDSPQVYYEIAEAGRRVLLRRQRWWERHKIGLQALALCVNMSVLLAVIYAGATDRDWMVVPAIVVLMAGFVALALVTWAPRMLEMVRTDHHALVMIGCRQGGGISKMPALLLEVSGPLRKKGLRHLHQAGLGSRELECLEVLREGWSGSIGELITASRRLSNI